MVRSYYNNNNNIPIFIFVQEFKEYSSENMNLTKTLASLKQEFSQVRSVGAHFKGRNGAAEIVKCTAKWSMG